MCRRSISTQTMGRKTCVCGDYCSYVYFRKTSNWFYLGLYLFSVFRFFSVCLWSFATVLPATVKQVSHPVEGTLYVCRCVVYYIRVVLVSSRRVIISNAFLAMYDCACGCTYISKFVQRTQVLYCITLHYTVALSACAYCLWPFAEEGNLNEDSLLLSGMNTRNFLVHLLVLVIWSTWCHNRFVMVNLVLFWAACLLFIKLQPWESPLSHALMLAMH